MSSRRLKCTGVPYRQGWIEVASGIHTGHINLEAWNVAPEVDLSPAASELSLLDDEQVCGNTEIELTVERAKELVVALQEAINAIEIGDA